MSHVSKMSYPGFAVCGVSTNFWREERKATLRLSTSCPNTHTHTHEHVREREIQRREAPTTPSARAVKFQCSSFFATAAFIAVVSPRVCVVQYMPLCVPNWCKGVFVSPRWRQQRRLEREGEIGEAAGKYPKLYLPGASPCLCIFGAPLFVDLLIPAALSVSVSVSLLCVWASFSNDGNF